MFSPTMNRWGKAAVIIFWIAMAVYATDILLVLGDPSLAYHWDPEKVMPQNTYIIKSLIEMIWHGIVFFVTLNFFNKGRCTNGTLFCSLFGLIVALIAHAINKDPSKEQNNA